MNSVTLVEFRFPSSMLVAVKTAAEAHPGVSCFSIREEAGDAVVVLTLNGGEFRPSGFSAAVRGAQLLSLQESPSAPADRTPALTVRGSGIVEVATRWFGAHRTRALRESLADDQLGYDTALEAEDYALVRIIERRAVFFVILTALSLVWSSLVARFKGEWGTKPGAE